jgi:hypothetical protein
MTRGSIGCAIILTMAVGLVRPAAAVDPQSIDWRTISGANYPRPTVSPDMIRRPRGVMMTAQTQRIRA